MTLKHGDGVAAFYKGEMVAATVAYAFSVWRPGTFAVTFANPSDPWDERVYVGLLYYADEGVTWCRPGTTVDYEPAFRVANALADHKGIETS